MEIKDIMYRHLETPYPPEVAQAIIQVLNRIAKYFPQHTEEIYTIIDNKGLKLSTPISPELYNLVLEYDEIVKKRILTKNKKQI
jgi:hypothetical protein